ncbi:unnamed protein product [Vicia faba]|uniref:Uncharacterized protein n=1 Tax=Vicia faba TaxID=3906 RepID=A0AAV1B1D9_VICFA|nr:unnamed protein product [Vicia faba]
MYNEYGNRTIPMNEYMFLSLGVCFPFTAFGVYVLNYLMVVPSQLHPTSWTYVKAYQRWCEYLKGKPNIVMFFHLFHYDRSTLSRPRGQDLVTLVPTIWIFKAFHEPLSFMDGPDENLPPLSGSHVNHESLPIPSYDCRDSLFDDVWEFFVGLSEKSSQEELYVLDRSAKQNSIALSLARFECWKALWFDQACEERVWVERSVNILASQWDTYLRELHKYHNSLQEVRKTLASFNFVGIVGS